MATAMLAAANVLAQPYGLDQAQAIGPYLNNVFPTTAPSSSASWHVEIAFTNILFDQPIFMLPYPGTNRLVILHKPGRIDTFPNRPEVTQPEVLPFLDISSRTFTVSDSGMTGMAFHPQFGQPGSTNRGYIYITYKWRPASVGTSFPEYAYWRLSRFTVPDGQMAADPNSEVVLVQQFDRQMWHDAGCMMFGPDGFLYFSCGDEGGANDQYDVTQTISERLMSGIFRIDVNQNPAVSHAIRRQPFHHPSMPAGWPESFTTNYFVPNDNPFVNTNGANLEEYYALGFRQPYRFSRDPVTGLIWVADSGQSTREEIDILVPGANYRWAYREGTAPGPKSAPGTIIGFEKEPLWDYGRDQGGSAIGGYVYRGIEHAGILTGKYIWVDNVSGRIWAITSDGTTLTNVEYLTSMPSGSVYGGTSSCGLDANGEIYFLKFGGDGAQRIFKLARSTTVVPDPPALLSQVGAFTNLSTLAVAPGLIPYNVNTPLWSDAAAKYRWIAVPNDGTHNTPGEKISFSSTNEWQFPAGTVFVKHFELAADENNPSAVHRLETRFIVRDQIGGVYGVTYKWRVDGSDADLLPGGTNANYVINTAPSGTRTQLWSFPSRLDCLSCHNANAKGVLGFKTHQLNGSCYYPVTGRTDNQLRTLGHLGMFTSEFQESQITNYLSSFNLTNTSQPLVTRVRSYLDANCAHCHRPGGQRANFDARYTIPLEQQNLIYGQVFDAVNDPDDRVIRPQDLLHSMIHNRANRVGPLQMPPLAKNMVDSNAVSVITAWINSLPTGPGVTLSRTNDGVPVAGPFAVDVEFSESVTGVVSGQFIVSNGQVTGLSGSGLFYTIIVTPQVKGVVNVQYAANQVNGSTGQGNYPSNPLSVSYDPLNAFLSTWLPFDEGSGAITDDASGHNNPGTLNNMASPWTPGALGNALTFDGVDDYVQLSNHLGASFTIACWVKTTQVFPQADPTYLGTGIIWADVGGGANDFILGGTRSAGGVNRLSFFVGSGGDISTSGTQSINTGQWTHLAVTREATNGAVRQYVNGTLDGSGTAGTAVLNANPNIHIGGNTLDGRYFNGSIDDVRFYSRVLSQAEIATLLLTTPPTVTLTTPSAFVTNSFVVTATFSEVVTGFASDDIGVQNGYLGPINGSGGLYTFAVTPLIPGPITVSFAAGRVTDTDGNGNLAATDLIVNATDPSIPVTGLVGYWSLNETNGTTAFDSSGAANNGTMFNFGNTNRIPGVWGNGLFFNGTNEYIGVINNIGGDFSLSLWIRTTQNFQQTTTTFNGTGIIWSDVGGTANDFILGGTRNGTTNRLSFFTGNPDSSVNGIRNISDDHWTHLAIVRTRSTGERRLFVNGAFEIASNGGTNVLTANAAIHIGGNTLNSRYFLGQMDEVRAYNRALSDSEVASLAAAGGYASWVAVNMPTNAPALTLPTADPDGDRQSNLLEYSFDTNPLATNASAFSIFRAGDGSLSLKYPRRTGFSGLRYTVLQSPDLINWTAVPNGSIDETTQPIPGKPLETVLGRIVNVTGKAYFRLQVQSLTP